MKATLQGIKPIKADLVPPVDAIAAGVTPEGKQIYTMTTQRSRGVPKLDPETGERIWRKNPLNGEPLLPVNKAELYELEEMFILEDQKNGNVEKIPYRHPTQAEIDARTRAHKIAAMQTGLAEKLVDSGFSVDDLLARLAPQSATVAPPADAPADAPLPDQTAYPVWTSGPWWKLSDGSKFKGSREAAHEAQAEIDDRKREAAATAALTSDG